MSHHTLAATKASFRGAFLRIGIVLGAILLSVAGVIIANPDAEGVTSTPQLRIVMDVQRPGAIIHAVEIIDRHDDGGEQILSSIDYVGLNEQGYGVWERSQWHWRRGVKLIIRANWTVDGSAGLNDGWHGAWYTIPVDDTNDTDNWHEVRWSQLDSEVAP